MLKSAMFFSSGPSYKGKHYSINNLNNALLSRSHRSPESLDRINYMISLIKKLLQIPQDYQIAIINGSCTAAIESIIWNLLGSKQITSLSWDCFADEWIYDIDLLGFKQHKFIFDTTSDACINTCINAFQQTYTSNDDLLFTWTSTTSGAAPNNINFLHTNGITVCDAAAAIFAQELPWEKLDATAFSLQKGLGSEAGLGIIILSPKAYKRLYEAPYAAVPRVLRLRLPQNKPEPNQKLFEGHTLNTISMLLVEDAIVQLQHIESIGIEKHYAKAKKNLETIQTFLHTSSVLQNVIRPEIQTTSSFCLQPTNAVWLNATIDNKWNYIKKIQEQIDLKSIVGHPKFLPCWRFWIGPMMDSEMILTGLKKLEKAIMANPYIL